jgi:hypothetical protein
MQGSAKAFCDRIGVKNQNAHDNELTLLVFPQHRLSALRCDSARLAFRAEGTEGASEEIKVRSLTPILQLAQVANIPIAAAAIGQVTLESTSTGHLSLSCMRPPATVLIKALERSSG